MDKKLSSGIGLVFLVFFTSLAGLLKPGIAGAQEKSLQTRFSITFDDLLLSEALDQLEQTSGFSISYSSSRIDAAKRVKAAFRATPLETILRKLIGAELRDIHVNGKVISLLISPGGERPDSAAIRRVHMEEVSVLGFREVQALKRQAFNVAALDARVLHNSTADLSHALDRITGVRVRESGGMGSSFNVSLSGFTGRQVKFFIDGVPMDNFGSAFNLNNIPVNLAERIEVYKGVVPVWLGADALGGAVNVVTSENNNFLDVSYAYGSFNTHRTVVNGAFTAKSGLTAQASFYQNYSENNYWVHVDVADAHTGAYTYNQRVRRFHDRYHNEAAVANIGVVDKPWADRFLVGVTLGKKYGDIQTAQRMERVYGAMFTRGNLVMPAVKYKKANLLANGLDVSLNANFNLGSEQLVDTANVRYDWFGNSKRFDGLGGEQVRTQYKYRNNNGLALVNAIYNMGDKHQFSLNNVTTLFNRKGSDVERPTDVTINQPRRTTKNITGAGYIYKPNDRWSATAFAKNYYQNTRARYEYQPTVAEIVYETATKSVNKVGYGVAGTYFIGHHIQLKASFERAHRLPDNEELFGDVVLNKGNTSLRPERSDNYNLGFSFRSGHTHQFGADLGLLYRAARDFIRPTLDPTGNYLVMQNVRDVAMKGLETELSYGYKQVVMAKASLTYQDIRNMTKYERAGQVSGVYKDRIPNLPYLFGNADATLHVGNLILNYAFLYVERYYLYWPSQGRDEKRYIPLQLSHDCSATYTWHDGRYNIALECLNLTDNPRYDHFSLQKPGRSANIKFRYFLKKTTK